MSSPKSPMRKVVVPSGSPIMKGTWEAQMVIGWEGGVRLRLRVRGRVEG